MPSVALANYGAGSDVERGEQGCRAIADIGMCPALRYARCHRQSRLLAIQRLKLGFFVHAQHDRPVRRRHVQADNVQDLVNE